LKYAGVKIVGDYVDNYKQGLPSEMALLNLFDPHADKPLGVAFPNTAAPCTI
jgi:alanine dehydrogenase